VLGLGVALDGELDVDPVKVTPEGGAALLAVLFAAYTKPVGVGSSVWVTSARGTLVVVGDGVTSIVLLNIHVWYESWDMLQNVSLTTVLSLLVPYVKFQVARYLQALC
jgi:hypothetical protein